MKASRNERKAEALKKASTALANTPANCVGPDDGVDIGLLDESLTKKPWERIQANDDALRFAETLRAAMKKRNAKPQRTDPPTR
jgi:hypothetical protein